MAQPIFRLGVPIDSVGAAGGTENGPAALRRLLTDLAVTEGGDTLNRLRGSKRDPVTGWLDFDAVLQMTDEVRHRVADLSGPDRRLLVLGGCCSLLPATLAGARDAHGGEPLGLAYLDGHMDTFEGATSPTGEAADMPVAVALGRAPDALLGKLGETPLLDPSRLCLIGARDSEEAALVPTPSELGIEWFRDRDSLRGNNLAKIGAAAEHHLVTSGRFWLHLDVDVLDQEQFRATDYLMPGGLTFLELAALIGPLAASPGLAGLSVTCYNPDKDPGGTCGRHLAGLITGILGNKGVSR